MQKRAQRRRYQAWKRTQYDKTGYFIPGGYQATVPEFSQNQHLTWLFRWESSSDTAVVCLLVKSETDRHSDSCWALAEV